MDRTTLALLTHELRNQCIYTEAAFRVFNQSLEQKATQGAFYGAQSILLTASQIGCMLWPPRARSRKRGEALREILQLAEKHPLNDKRLLTIWEHADEKFDDWLGRTKGQQIVFDHIGPLAGFAGAPESEENLYRLYDPAEMVFYFRGDGFKLQAIANSISDIYARANALHAKFFPEQQGDGGAPAPDAAENSSASATEETPEDQGVEKAAKKPPVKKKTKSPSKKSSSGKASKAKKKK